MDPRIPPILQPLVQDYVHMANEEMPGRITAAYLVGSIAAGQPEFVLGQLDDSPRQDRGTAFELGHLVDRLGHEAIALREDPKPSYFRPRVKRAIEAFGFLNYIIRSCNDYVDAN